LGLGLDLIGWAVKARAAKTPDVSLREPRRAPVLDHDSVNVDHIGQFSVVFVLEKLLIIKVDVANQN
jgi:hypothetical protein